MEMIIGLLFLGFLMGFVIGLLAPRSPKPKAPEQLPLLGVVAPNNRKDTNA